MKINKYFSFKRLLLQVRNDISRNYRTWLLTLGAVTGILVAIDILPGIFAGKPYVPVVPFYIIFLLIGFIFSSVVFSEIHDSQKGLVYFTIPASNLERVISKILISNIFYILISFVYFKVMCFLLGEINGVIFGLKGGAYSFNWDIARAYFILQSIFLFASSYFKSKAFIKLIFSLFVLNILFSIYFTAGFRLVFQEALSGNMNYDLSFTYLPDLGINIFNSVKFIFNWIFAPFFWVLTYLKIREKEI